MKMLYEIKVPSPIKEMSGYGIYIKLWPEWKEAVSRSGLNQTKVDSVIKGHGRYWLDSCGFDGLFDPDNCGFDKDKTKPLGPNARPFYMPNHDLRVSWGEWGIEHITVPGDACGLDITENIGCPRNGKVLCPHNVDNMRQAYLILVVFSWFGEAIIANEEELEYKNENHPR